MALQSEWAIGTFTLIIGGFGIWTMRHMHRVTMYHNENLWLWACIGKSNYALFHQAEWCIYIYIYIYIYISKLGHHLFREWLVAYPLPEQMLSDYIPFMWSYVSGDVMVLCQYMYMITQSVYPIDSSNLQDSYNMALSHLVLCVISLPNISGH